MRRVFQTEQWVPFPVDQVFAFFSNPENLPKLMPQWQRARIESATFIAPPEFSSYPGQIVAGAGSTMVISFRPVPFSPVRQFWDAAITEFVWGSHFCDEQQQGHGPFAYWRHCHRVRSEQRASGEGTVVTDELTYELPLGALGDVANALGGRQQIRAIFTYRQQMLPKLLKDRMRV